jgi:hypothetical protein
MSNKKQHHIVEATKMVTAVEKWIAKQDRFALIRTSRNYQRKYL